MKKILKISSTLEDMKEDMNKISVLMPVFLGDYPFAATEREAKFKRAVDSFIAQEYQEKELLIVSDGCERTIICAAQYTFHPNIKIHQIPKQELFSGVVRNTALFYATGDIICYLDADDILGKGHLQAIANGFNSNPDAAWIYFDDYIIYRFNPQNREVLSKAKRVVSLEGGIIGTSSIAHRKLPEYSWAFCDGYGHDWTFIQKLINSGKAHTKIDGCEYYVCHIPNSVDC